MTTLYCGILIINYKLEHFSFWTRYILCLIFPNGIRSEANSSSLLPIAAMLKSMMAVLRSITPRLCRNGANSVCETFIRHPYLSSITSTSTPLFSVSVTSMFSPSTKASTAIMVSCVRTWFTLDSRDYRYTYV